MPTSMEVREHGVLEATRDIRALVMSLLCDIEDEQNPMTEEAAREGLEMSGLELVLEHAMIDPLSEENMSRALQEEVSKAQFAIAQLRGESIGE